MLVISRKKGEAVQVGDDIEVTILKVEGKRIHLGITAPLEVIVLRGELTDDDDEG